MAWELLIFAAKRRAWRHIPDWPRKGGFLLTRPISWVKGANLKAHEIGGSARVAHPLRANSGLNGTASWPAGLLTGK